MSVSGVIDRLDDWINPIVIKELRQAVKSRLVTAVLLLFLGVQMLIVALTLGWQALDTTSTRDPMDWNTGNQIFLVLQAILLGTCMVLIPAYASVRMSGERSDTNVDLLFISTLRPTSIVAGKFFSALVLAMLVYSCCAPFMTFTYLLRGIDMPSILFVLGVDLLAVLLSTQIGLFLASIPAPRAFKVFIFFIAFIMLCYIYAALVALTSELVHEGVASMPDSRFWAVMGVSTLAVLFSTGLLFCWSVALISPPSANRAPLGRIFLVVMWLILGVSCAVLSLDSWRTGGHHGPMMVWTACSVLLFCIQFTISINERDSWGPRVARTIPRWRILRPLAFLFYSGSAGGVLLSVLCVTLTLFASWGWRTLYPTFTAADDSDELRRIFAALALYFFCYGMSAVLIRSYLLADKIHSLFTWVVGLLLVGLGSSLPWIAAFCIYFDDFGRHDVELHWWALTNPFAAIYEMTEVSSSHGLFEVGDFTTVCFLFLGGWALLLSLLSLHWGVQQILRFHPPASRRGKASLPAPRALEEMAMATPAEVR
jgi:hypothetical protein